MTSVRRLTLTQLADRALIGASVALPVVVAFSNALAEITSTVLIVWLIVCLVLDRGRLPSGGVFTCLVAVWLVACFISAASASEPSPAFRTFLRKTVQYAAVALAMSFVGRDERRLRLILKTLAWAGIVFSIDGLVQWKFGHDLLRWREPWASRLTGPMGNPNNFATYLVMVMPIQLWLVFGGAKRWQAMVMLLGILASILPIILTDSRMAWLVFAVNLMAFAVLAKRVALLAYPVILGIGLLLSGHLPSLQGLFDLSPGRAEGWTVAWRMFLDHPIVGIGHGSYMAHYMEYLPSLAGTWPRPQYAHNCYLQLLAEGGVLGLGAFMLLVGWVLQRAWRRLLRPPTRMISPLIGLAVSLVAFLVSIVFDTGLYSLPIASLFWSLLGLTVGSAATARTAATS